MYISLSDKINMNTYIHTYIFAPEGIFCEKIETKNWRPLNQTHSSKSHHGLRKWNSSLHHASSTKSFRTSFTHEHRNCITGEGNDTANARMIVAHEKAFACVLEHVTTHIRNQKGIGRRSSCCLVYIQELTRNTYDNLNLRNV